MFQLQRVGSHGSTMSKIKTFKRLSATGGGEWASWPGGFVIITEGSGMVEHLFRAKQMHSRRKCIPT